MKYLNIEKMRKNLEQVGSSYLELGYVCNTVMIVNQGGKRVATVKLGVQHPGSDIAVDENSFYRLASLTKPVTGVAALIAEEQGLFSLNDLAADHLPQFATMGIGKLHNDVPCFDRPAETPLRLYHFLSHCSGFMSEDAFGLKQIGQVPPSALENISTVVEYCSHNSFLSFEPESQTAYSTYAFDVIAHLIEKYSGMSYERFLDTYLFKPLGISDITFQPTPEQWSRMVTIGTRGATGAFEPVNMDGFVFETMPLSYAGAGSSLCGTAEDYSKFAEMLLGKGQRNGVRILKESSVNRLNRVICGRWGLSVLVRDESAITPAGTYGWSGAYGTHFWVDDENQITGVLMKNHKAVPTDFWMESRFDMERAVMAALE